MIPSGDFIPLIESMGLIVELGNWALDMSVRDFAMA